MKFSHLILFRHERFLALDNRHSAIMTPRAIFLLFIACGLVYIPFLLIPGIYWDDWAWFWVSRVEGLDRLFDYTLQMRHPGYWFPLALFYGVGGEHAGILARVFAVVCHLVNGILLYRILRRPLLTRDISVWAAAIYLLSPFYYARGTISHAIYDIFMFFYLFSIWLLRSGRRRGNLLAVGAFIISLFFETLMFLEPLRVLFVHRGWKGVRNTIRRCVPFWIMFAAFTVARVVWLKPYGDFASYNQLRFSMLPLLQNLARHGRYYLRGVGYTLSSALKLASWPGIITLGVLGLLIAWLFSRRSRRKEAQCREGHNLVGWQLLFGTLLAILGALPYALIGRVPSSYAFYSRFAYISIPGISIIGAALIMAIRHYRIRISVFFIVMMILALSSLRITKWYIYDSLVQRELVMKLVRIIPANLVHPPLFILKMVPSTREVLVLNRRMDPEDLNAPVNLARNTTASPVFIYDEESVDGLRRPEGYLCTVTWHDRYPCPESLVRLEYRLNADNSSVDRMSYWVLLKSVFLKAGESPDMGMISSPDGWLDKNDR